MDRVYILECNGLHKIGYTSQENLNTRVNQMKTGNPFTINIVRDYHCEDNDGLKKEQRLHKLYHDKRKEGEWFKLNQTDLMQIDKLMGVDIIDRELQGKKKKLSLEVQKLERSKVLLQREINYLASEAKKYGLKDTESNHIKLDGKKINLKKKYFDGKEVLNGETKFASKSYFVNVYFNNDGGSIYFKRKKKLR